MFIKYEHVKLESREYKYGPGEEFDNEYMAKENILKLKSNLLEELIREGFTISAEEIKVVKKQNAFKLTALIKY